DDPINPWLGIATAVARKTWAGSVLGTSETVSAGEGMLCYTANGARALGLEKELGAIATGKDAELIVLPRDPFTDEEPVRLAALRTTAVIVRGKVVHGALACPDPYRRAAIAVAGAAASTAGVRGAGQGGDRQRAEG